MTANPNGWSGGSTETVKYLSDEEVDRFFSSVKAEKDVVQRARDLALFSVVLAYGLRAAEVALLKLEHLNLDARPAQIYVTRVKRKKNPKTGQPKPRLGRWYELSEKNERLLRDWLRARKRLPGTEGTSSVFVTKRGKEIDSVGLWKHVRKTAGEGFHPHQFRHTCGVRLARRGLSAFEIKERLGHVSVLSTEVYVQLAGRDRLEMDRRADAALEGRLD
jgi:integrase